MKAEITITLNEYTDEPEITIFHRDKCNDAEQRVLGLFLKQAKEHGLTLKYEGGFLASDGNNCERSKEHYKIIINKNK